MNGFKRSSHDVNLFSALVVTLVDLFGPICAPLILSPSSISPYMFYIFALWALWLLMKLDVECMCREKAE